MGLRLGESASVQPLLAVGNNAGTFWFGGNRRGHLDCRFRGRLERYGREEKLFRCEEAFLLVHTKPVFLSPVHP